MILIESGCAFSIEISPAPWPLFLFVFFPNKTKQAVVLTRYPFTIYARVSRVTRLADISSVALKPDRTGPTTRASTPSDFLSTPLTYSTKIPSRLNALLQIKSIEAPVRSISLCESIYSFG